MSSCQSQFLVLATKASIWCGKHLKMTLMSTEESQEEEHSNLFFQLLLDLLSYSAAIYSALARNPVSVDKESMDIREKFIIEQLNLTRDLISEIKRIDSHGSEVLKVAHMVIDAVIRLCGVYAQDVNCKFSAEKLEMEKNNMKCEGIDNMNHVINITKCTIEKLREMGIIAANIGGSLVSMLNVSWKGVVTLLQLGEGLLAIKMNVADIISTLILLVNDSLKCAAEAWSSLLKETVSVTEARRKFLPVKFYLINAVKISSLYPCQACTVHRELTHCILMISTFKVLMSNEKLLKNASEVFSELLEKTSFDLLNSLLNSDQVEQKLKFEVLDSMFSDESFANSIPGDLSGHNKMLPMDGLFSISSQVFSGVRTTLLGQVVLFLSFLRYSPDLEEDVKLGITRKLGWLLDSLIDEGVYSSVLVLQIPVLCGSGKNVELVWQPMFSSLLDALKTFSVVVSSSVAWIEVESFLLENLFHPHFLCWEIVMELWCFIIRYAESGMVSGIIIKLCSLLKLLAYSESVFVPDSGMRKLARSISMLLKFGAQSMIDQVFKSIIGDDTSELSSVVCLALFMEGFPLNLLSDKMKSVATERILADFFSFIESFEEKSIKACNDGVLGVPVFALSASLPSLQINLSDIDVKTLRFLVSVIHNYGVSVDKLVKDQHRKLLSETLGIISNMKHLYAYEDMEKLLFKLENLFISGPAASDRDLYECKPNLALFMSGLAHMPMTETDKSTTRISAACELYQMMLRERHWALAHLAITAFGYFSARTSCDELWRFVPHDAALSYDLETGKLENEERFMSDFKVFLDKEATLGITSSRSEQLGLLLKEGLILKEMLQKILTIKVDTVEYESMEIDGEKQSKEVEGEKEHNKKRKLPEGISKGMELLERGLKVIVNGLSQWQQSEPESSEFHVKFMSHFSRLEDEIGRLAGLAGGN
ncbi:holliday junction resolvase [Parasponia andersonii]|uniref:Holliday junction resolvase n=1 Tax=Parasponia andersonii TaxID=3476 RepID=A0A2P5AV00_PARAD|nr:holliday junction resolvase [Parasponia andersonii]